ncbi:MAG: hypothetical protein EG823_01745 [Actinobacteria bacterium]|nr:hypothetical protein [Actinomycetota bacterium]
MLGGMRDHPWTVAAVIVLLNVLSLVDGWFTAAELGLGIARESNPVLAAASAESPWIAVWTKVGAMLVVSVVIWHGRRRRSVLALALVALALFAGLVGYHIVTLQRLGWL